MGFYDTQRWKRKREMVLRLDGYKDVLALRDYGRTVQANHVHHIYPRREYPEYALETWNLISVSSSTHNTLEDRATGQLTERGKALMRRTVPGEDWRKKKYNYGTD